jgi:hypothetical protein
MRQVRTAPEHADSTPISDLGLGKQRQIPGAEHLGAPLAQRCIAGGGRQQRGFSKGAAFTLDPVDARPAPLDIGPERVVYGSRSGQGSSARTKASSIAMQPP